jgi:hypothetical protein
LRIRRLVFLGMLLLLTVAPINLVSAQDLQSMPDEQNTTPAPSGADVENPTFGGIGQSAPLPPKPKSLPDEVPRGETVTDRPRPDYDPIGQRVGSFILYPNATFQESYETNILGSPTQPVGDFISSLAPSLDMKSDWNNHALNFHADGSIQKYAEHSSQDYNDYTFGSDGRLDIDRDAQLFGTLGYSERHEPVWSPDNPGNVHPSLVTIVPEPYTDFSGSVAGQKAFNRLSFRLDATYDDFRFSDVTSASGIPVPMHLEDYSQEQLTLRTTYELAPLRQIYLLTSYNWIDYAAAADLGGFNRTSNGYMAALGTRYDLTGIVFADFYAGYLDQSYKDPRLPAITGPAAGLKLTWNVTRLTTITGSFNRSLAETILPGASGYFDTNSEIRIDHELLRNVILNGSIGYEQDAFHGVQRIDNYYLAGLGAKYLLNHNFWLSIGYTFQTRDSSQSINNFNDNIILLSLSAHL